MIVDHDSVLSSANYIYSLSKNVTCNEESISRIADKISSCISNNERTLWSDHPLNPKTADKRAVNWIFVCDLLNFSFWLDDHDSSYVVEYEGISYSGYWAFCAALNRAEAEGHSLHDFAESQSLSFLDFSFIFRSGNASELPLLRERYEIFRAAAKKLVDKYGGCFTNLIAMAGNDALSLINILIIEFPSFQDYSWYKGRQVFFLKRAQILVADLWACFKNEGFGRFDSVEFITVFADYRIPQLLNHAGVLLYSDELQRKLENYEHIPPGSETECEIRGLSIYSANCIRERILARHPDLDINSISLDFFLWVLQYMRRLS